MKPTVRDIASKAGVSIASVSLVLNDKPSRITEATKQKILDAARELGYRREKKPVAETDSEKERAGKYPLIGVIRSGVSKEFLDDCQLGIDGYAYIHGYKCVVCNVADCAQALEYVKVLRRIGTKGIVMIPPKDMNENKNNEKLGKALKGAKIPFVLLDQAVDRVFCDFITGDNKGSAYMAAEYLIHKGYQEIGLICESREIYSSRKRIEGYKEALAFYGLSIKEENIFYGDDNRETGRRAMEHFADFGIRAVVAEGEMAFGVYKYACEHGKQIGKDIAVIGFNTSSAAELVFPPMTCIKLPGELMGKKACEVLVKRIEENEKDAVTTTYFAPVIVERDSV